MLTAQQRDDLNEMSPVAKDVQLGDRLRNLSRGGVFTGAMGGFGDVFYVNKAPSSLIQDGKTWENACLTIDAAINLCQANHNDIIYVAPGHTETIADATSLVMDVANITVIGIGRGSLTPTLTFSAAASNIPITGANCGLFNLKLISDFTNGVTKGITLGAAADGCILDGILFTETSVTKEWLIGIYITAACHDVTINGLTYKGTPAGGTTSVIEAAGAANGLVLKNSYIQCDASAAAVKLDGAASTDIEIAGNRLVNIDTGAGLGVAIHASSTGMVSRNLTTNLKDTIVGITGAGMAFHENYSSNALNASGIILPAVDS